MSKDRAAQLVEAGIWLKLSGDREGAAKLFERALKLDPENEKAAELSGGAPVPGEGEVERASGIRPRSNSPVPVPGAHPFERPVDALPGDRDRELATGGSGVIPEPSLDEDWGRMTGATTPVPQILPVVPSNQQPQTVSLDGDAVLETPALFGEPPQSSRSGTMQLYPDTQSSRSGTMQLYPDAGDGPPTSSRSGTMQLYPEPSMPAPRTTLPEFAAVRTVTLGHDDGGFESPPPSTPPLFGPPPASPPPPEPQTAWGWSPSLGNDAEPLAPRPSPHLAPRAESAWDQRSNPGIKLESVVGRDRALELISSDSKITRAAETRQDEVRIILRGARDLLELDDHTGAMELINKAQALAPDDAEVIALKERSEKTLLTMFESKVGRLETVPRVLLKDDEIIWLNLDHRAGFVLAQIDGTVTFDDLFSVSGMSRIDTARILAQLIDEGVISRG